jgi:hypothetical protein
MQQKAENIAIKLKILPQNGSVSLFDAMKPSFMSEKPKILKNGFFLF